MNNLVVADEVADALHDKRPVVALESTIFSNLGLPSPANADALDRCLAAIRNNGGVPAVTAVLDGVPRLGITPDEHERILGNGRKAAARDLSVAIGQHWSFGATTVSAALSLASAGGVQVFATGGIGGVHRDSASTGDISADLGAIATKPLVTVCAGAKVFLDLPATLEHLETLGVPVLGWRTNEFPAFTTPTSGLPIHTRVEDASEVARIVRASAQLGLATGTLVTVPIKAEDGLSQSEIDQALQAALDAVTEAGIVGPAVTPFVLEHIAATTEGRSVPANLALAEQNAMVATEIASALLDLDE
ncbi:MAG: pseudouridine-5'-phosphate glycosidase [Acidimicrobiia bacterium]